MAELSDLVQQQEIPRGTILTVEQLNAYGLYDTRKMLGNQAVYYGEGKGVCILDQLDGALLRCRDFSKRKLWQQS